MILLRCSSFVCFCLFARCCQWFACFRFVSRLSIVCMCLLGAFLSVRFRLPSSLFVGLCFCVFALVRLCSLVFVVVAVFVFSVFCL